MEVGVPGSLNMAGQPLSRAEPHNLHCPWRRWFSFGECVRGAAYALWLAFQPHPYIVQRLVVCWQFIGRLALLPVPLDDEAA